MHVRRIFTLLATVALASGCAGNTDQSVLSEPIAPAELVERAPYIVGLDEDSVVIRYTTFQPVPPGIRYWAEEGDTTRLRLERTGRNHEFEIVDLRPWTEYTYQIQVADTVWSEPATFRTFPEPGSKKPFTFLVLGDSGTRNSGQLALAEVINAERAQLLLHVGDLAYPDGTEEEFTERFFGVYAPLLARSPVFPAPGDHDFRTDWGRPYREALVPPGGWGSGSPWYYAFTHGNARFISLDTKDSEDHAERFGYIGDPSSEQYRWLLLQLSAARADPAIDWTIVYFHHAPYSASTGFGGHGSHLLTRRALAPLMDGYGVPLAFSGHDHDYQRSKPIRGNRIVEENEGTVYVVSGGGGGRRTFRGTGSDWFTAYSEQVYQFVRVGVDHYRLTLEAVNLDGEVFDSVELVIPEDERKPYVEEREAVPAIEAPAAGSTLPE